MSMIVNPFRFSGGGGGGAPEAWMTALDLDLNASANSFSNYTVRNYVTRLLLPASATKFRVTFKAGPSEGMTLNKAYIGLSELLTYQVAPTQMFFGGSPGFVLAAGASITSDEINLAYDGTREICVSFFIPSGSGASDLLAYRGAVNPVLAGGQYAGGDSAASTGGTWTVSTDVYSVQKVEAYTGGSWKNILTSQATTQTGFANYTIRSRLSVGQLVSAKDTLRVGMGCRCADLFIGNWAGGADPLAFASTPTRLTFGGSNGTPAVDYRVYMTDGFPKSTVDLSQPVVLSYFTDASRISRRPSPPSGQLSGYKAGNVVSNLGFSADFVGADYFGPSIFDEQY